VRFRFLGLSCPRATINATGEIDTHCRHLVKYLVASIIATTVGSRVAFFFIPL
jgi:hypothetical protein